MKTPRLHPSVELAWALSSVEGCGAGSETIEPAHLLLAVLKVLDEGFPASLSDADLPESVREDVGRDGAAARRLLTLTPSGVTKARRSLRAYLRQGRQPAPTRQLHRSARTRALMDESARRAQADGVAQLHLAQLLAVLLENLPEEAKPFLGSQARAREGHPERPSVPERGGSHGTGGPLESLGRDLTALARDGRLAPVVGRKAEMTMLARHLHRTSKRNAILIGDAGVGKTAVVEGLAQRIASGQVPQLLQPLRIVQVSVGDLMSGTHYRGDLEERVQALLKSAYSDPNLVLFLDELHLVVSAGSGGLALDIANLLKPALAREDFRCIGATTTDEFERYIRPDPAFTRRFQVVRVSEPSIDEAIEVCRAWARRIEQLQRVVFEADAIAAAVRLSAAHLRSRALPDKAIDLLENAAAFVRVSSLSAGGGRAPSKTPPIVRQSDLVAVLEEQYGVSVTPSGAMPPDRVAAAFASLVGQDDAVTSIVATLKALSVRSGEEARPLGVLLFAGPSGVGKTLAAESLARALFPEDPAALARLNMNELKERHEIARLIGAPPGFLGHENQGALFRFTSAHPTGVVLLDEMDKAHPEIQDYFLQIFDKAEATDSRGTKTDFRKYLFVMTCNAGSRRQNPRIGFATGATQPETTSEEPDLSRLFRPEFLGRIDRVVTFHSLDVEARRELLVRALAALGAELRSRGVDIQITPEAQAWVLAVAGVDQSARELIRWFEHEVRGPTLGYVRDTSEASQVHLRMGKDGLTCST